MKQFTILLILLTVSVLNINAADLEGNSISLKGKSNTNLGDYEIREILPANVNGVMMRMFVLAYEKAKKSVVIYLNEKAKCREYIVRSNNLEVRYACNETSFGAQLLSARQMKYKPELNALFLSREEFEKQQVITKGGLPVDSALGLIASYYPNLLKTTELLN